MDQLPQINLNGWASIQDPSEKIIQQQQRQNVDNDTIESGSETVIVKSNNVESSLIRAELIAEETQAAANGEEKKRKHWKEDEHRQFLKGLEKYQRGQWKEISKEFVTTRSPSQIASHAQKYYDRKDAVEKARKKRRSIHDTTIDNNGRLVIHPFEKQNEIPSIQQQQREIPSRGTTLNVISSIEQQNKITPLITRSFHHPFNMVRGSVMTSSDYSSLSIGVAEDQSVILPTPSHDATLNDNNNDNLVTPPVEPLQGVQQEHMQLLCIIRTRDILPHDLKNVTKMCELIQKTVKR